MKNQEGSWIQTARIPTIVFLCVRKSGLPSDDSKMCGYGNTTVIRGRTYRRQGGGGESACNLETYEFPTYVSEYTLSARPVCD